MKLSGAILLTAFLGGCKGESGDDGNKKPEWLNGTIKPTNLLLSLDTSSTKSQIVQPSGGTMEVGAADGSFFVLQIPAGALAAPARITMTPVARAEGLPGSSRMVATVQLAPEGLQLRRPAKLIIQPAEPVDESEAYGYAYSAAGSDAHLHPAQGDPANVELSLSHFSGYGILHIQPTDLALRVLRRVKGEGERLEAAISRSLLEGKCAKYLQMKDSGDLANESKETTEGLERRCRGVSGDADMEDVLRLAVEYYQFAVRPLWLLALKDAAAYDCAWRAGRKFQRQIALLTGIEDTLNTRDLDAALARKLLSGGSGWGKYGDELTERLNDQSNLEAEARALHIKTVLDRVRERCQKGDLAVVRDAFAMAHVFGLQGEDDTRLQAQASDLLRRCAGFELEFVSQVTNGFPDGKFSYEVRAVAVGAPRFVPDSLRRDSGNWNVVAPLVYVRHEAQGHPRGATANFSSAGKKNSTIRIHSVEPVQGQDIPALDCQGVRIMVSVPNADTMQVRLQIEAPTERIRLGGNVSEVQNWHGHFYNFRRYEEQLFEATEEMSGGPPPPEGYPLILLLPRSGSTSEWRLDFKTEDNPGSGLSLTERGHIILRLKPQL